VSGEFREGNAQVAHATLVLVERRSSEPRQTLGWIISSDVLKGHVKRIRLRDTNTGVVYYDIVVSEAVGIRREFGETIVYAGTVSFNVLLDLLNTGKVRLHIDTDLPGRDVVTITLGSPTRKDWSQPHCS
jgi:hypothetical protein